MLFIPRKQTYKLDLYDLLSKNSNEIILDAYNANPIKIAKKNGKRFNMLNECALVLVTTKIWKECVGGCHT